MAHADREDGEVGATQEGEPGLLPHGEVAGLVQVGAVQRGHELGHRVPHLAGVCAHAAKVRR
jgi:hypothetical protein